MSAGAATETVRDERQDGERHTVTERASLQPATGHARHHEGDGEPVAEVRRRMTHHAAMIHATRRGCA